MCCCVRGSYFLIGSVFSFSVYGSTGECECYLVVFAFSLSCFFLPLLDVITRYSDNVVEC